jgi:hypothetical protein
MNGYAAHAIDDLPTVWGRFARLVGAVLCVGGVPGGVHVRPPWVQQAVV